MLLCNKKLFEIPRNKACSLMNCESNKLKKNLAIFFFSGMSEEDSY